MLKTVWQIRLFFCNRNDIEKSENITKQKLLSMTWFGCYKPEEKCSSLPMVTGHWRTVPGKSKCGNWSTEIRQQSSTSVCC